MRTKKTLIIIFEVVLLSTVVIASVVCAKNTPSFWEINISQALTLIVAILIAFGAAQFKNDERKAKEQVEKLIDKIQQIVSEQSFFMFDNKGTPDSITTNTTIKCRKLSNCIDILKEYSDSFDIKNEVDYLYTQYKEYYDFFSEHINDLEYLNKSISTFRKYSENISSKCDRIIVKLYKG